MGHKIIYVTNNFAICVFPSKNVEVFQCNFIYDNSRW